MKKGILILWIIFSGAPGLIQGNPSINLGDSFRDEIYRASIRTVILEQQGSEGSLPIIELGSNTLLHLQFDDLDPMQKQLYYAVEHCNADWKPSGIMFSYYLQGLRQDIMQDFRYSINTRQQYIHYDLVFPNQNMQIILSGNYVLKVYEDGNPDNLILTRRFMVYKDMLKVSGKIKRPSGMELRNTHQEVDAMVLLENYHPVNAQVSTKLIIMQNGRQDNTIMLKPFGINHERLNYDYDDGSNCFDAGNEFRTIDIRSLRQQSISVRHFEKDSGLVKAYLLDDPVRHFLEYQLFGDINGKYFIRNSDGLGEPQIDGDYVWVNFSLPFEAPLTEGELYVFGGLSDWQYREPFKMRYDYGLKSYTLRTLLKQGIYNYWYVFMPAGEKKGDVSLIEGSRFNTENDYIILIYTRGYTNNFDELTGLCRLNSLRNQ